MGSVRKKGEESKGKLVPPLDRRRVTTVEDSNAKGYNFD